MAFSNLFTMLAMSAVIGSNKSKASPAPSRAPAQDDSDIMSDEIKELNRQIDELKTHMSDENNKIKNETGNINSENSKLIALQKRLNELLKLLRKAQNTDEEINRIKLELEKIKEQVRVCNSNLSGFKDLIIKSTDKLQTSLSDYKKLNDTYLALLPKRDMYNAQLALDEMDINNYSGQISDLKDQIIKLETIIKADKLELDKLNEIVNSLDNKIMALILKIYSNIIYNNENILKLNQTIDASLNRLFSYLKKKNTQSDTIYEKINYRDIEHEKLYNKNKLLDVLFYCFYFSFILIMICTQNIKREYFLIYLFVGLIPFIYPFLFKFVLYLITYLSNDNHGPKNAFIDINNTIYAYNR